MLAGPQRRRSVAEQPVAVGLVVEDAASGFCGAVVNADRRSVSLQDRAGRVRIFPLQPAGFRLDGVVITLVPAGTLKPAATVSRRTRTASGSFTAPAAVAGSAVRARVARAGRIWVEGDHDAALLERVWGADLREEGVVVEAIRGLDHLADAVRAFQPGPGRRLGVLADHLVPGSKESRIVATVTSPHVRVTGHPYVDVWQAVKPTSLGITAWPVVPRGRPWKDGVAAALGYVQPGGLWRQVLASVDSYTDVEVPLLRAVEQLIDFVTAPDG